MKNLHKPAKQVKPWHAGKNVTKCLKRQPCISGHKTAQTKVHIKRRSGASISECHSCCALDRDFSFHTSSFTLCCSHSAQSEHVNNTQNEIFERGFPLENEDAGFWFPLPYATVGRVGKRRSCVFWFGTDQPYKRHILHPTVSQDRNRYLRVEKTQTERKMKAACQPYFSSDIQ